MIIGTMGAVIQLYTISMGISRPFVQYLCTMNGTGQRLNSLRQISKSRVCLHMHVMDERG